MAEYTPDEDELLAAWMTTDPFIEAARAEAKRLDDQYDLEWEGPQNVFVRAAAWARAHLAAQEPTDAALVDLWWATCDDEWAVPDDVMIAFGRAVLARAARAARRDEEKR